MRIGIDCRFYSKHNGIGRYISELINELAKLDQDNEYILFFNEPEFSDFQPPAPNFQPVLSNCRHYSLGEQTKFLYQLLKAKLDLMHFTNFNAPILYYPPTIVTIHDLTLHFFPGKKLNRPWHRLAYHLAFRRSIKHARNVICVSQHTADDLQQKYPEIKTTVIPLGVSDDFIKAPHQKLRKKYQLPQKYLLFAGNWREHKNIPNLIRAFALLKEKYNYKGKLALTGEPQPDHSDVPELVSQLQLEKQIIFLGRVPHSELPSLYRDAEAFVFPSLYEGFGLPALEAMQTETPVICSQASCLPEVCGPAAHYFDPEDPEDMAEQINTVISSNKLKEKLVELGQQQLTEYSFSEMAQATLELYNQR